MNKHTIFPATNTSRTKRVAFGAASVLTAGALLGVGAQGATAAPLPAENMASTSTSASTSGDAENGVLLASLAQELRGDLADAGAGADGDIHAGNQRRNTTDGRERTASGHPSVRMQPSLRPDPVPNQFDGDSLKKAVFQEVWTRFRQNLRRIGS